MARLRKTLTDYLVIGISPALIMLLIGSLVYFLIAVFYHGGYPGRVSYVFALFVFASVLIARISIEEGHEYSMIYAIALGLAMLLVMGRFTSTPFLFNVVMLVLVLWCADRLTWDCTVIDDQEDASGEGLLQTAGLEGAQGSDASTPPVTAHDLEATTSREPTPPPKTLWGRFLEHRRRPHAPGVWVIYFSLAALPLFGIGQRFIPAEDVEARRDAFKLLCIYTASGLGLLLTTSFLGLRRYLRQRRLEMPLEMASVWMTVGSLMIVALLFVAWLLPRPHPEYSITQVPFQVATPGEPQASRHGWGGEGAEDKQRQAQTAAPAKPDQEGRPGDRGAKGRSGAGQPKSDQGQGKSPGGQQSEGRQPGGQGDAGKPSGGASQAQGKSGQPSPGSQAGDKRDSSGQSGNQGQEQQGSKQGSEAGEKQSQSGSSESSSPADGGQPSSRKEPGGQSQAEQQGTQSQGGPPKTPAGSEPSRESSSEPKPADAPSGSEPPQSKTEQDPFQSEVDPSEAPEQPSSWMPSPSEMLNSLLGLIPYGLSWLYNLAFLALVAFLIWRNREQVLKALRDFWAALKSFWDNLFGVPRSEPAGEEAAAVTAEPPRPFAAFPDPFVTGEAQRWPPRELVSYSFQALEAWGREHGRQRGPEQTPHEFAGCLADCETPLGEEALRLAELYCRAAYSSGSLPRDQVSRLQTLWKLMRTQHLPEPA